MDKELLIKLKLDRSQATQANRQFVADAKAGEKAVLSEVQVAEKAKAALVAQTNRERINAAAQSMKAEITAAKEATGVHTQAFAAVKTSIGNVAGSLTELVSAFSVLRGVASTINTIADAWKKVEESQISAGKAALDYEKQSRELATLMGKGQASQVVPEALDFSLRTGLAATDADNFRRQFLGSLPAGLQKGNITQETADELAVQAGQMAARQGGDASTRGDLAGIIAQFGKIGSAKEGLGTLEAVRMGLTEGRGDDTPLTQALLHVAGSLVKEKGGPVASLPELASVVGAMSLSSGPGMADSRTEQLMRGLRGSTKEQQQFLETTFGVRSRDTAEGPRDTLESALDKVAPKLREVGKTQDIASYLTASGINEEQARALAEATENYELIKERMAKARNVQGLGGQVQGLNQDFLKSPLGRSMLGENRKLAAEVNRGRTEKDYSAMLDLEQAEQNVPERHTVGQQVADWATGIRRNVFNITSVSGAREEGERRRIQQGVLNRLREQAAQVGVSREELNQRGLVGGILTEPEPAEEAKALQQLIRTRGGDPYASYEKSQIESENEMNRQRAMLPAVPQTTVPGLDLNAPRPALPPVGAAAAGMEPASAPPNPRGFNAAFEPEGADNREIVDTLKQIRDKLPEKAAARDHPVIVPRPVVQTR